MINGLSNVKFYHLILPDGKIYPESTVNTLLRNVGFYPPNYRVLICVSPSQEI